MTRPLSLRTRFGIASAVLLVVVGVSLSLVLHRMIEDRARAQAEQTALVAVRLGITPRMAPQDFARVLPQAHREALDMAMAESAAQQDGHHPVRIKVFNGEGTVVYSDVSDLLGETFDNDDVDAALRGEVVSEMTYLEESENQHEQHFAKLLEVYVPVSYGDDDPVGVVELYLPYAPVEQAIRRDLTILYATLVPLLLLFYVGMFRMVAKASRRLDQQAKDLWDSVQQSNYLAHHDSLTDLPNRVLLNERLERAVIEARRHGTDVAVLLIDLDRFKEINDTLGHEIGDALLVQVGHRLVGELREMDTVARLGGDEFAVLLPEAGGLGAATTVAERLLDALHRPFVVSGLDLAVEASIGIACYPDQGDDRVTLLQHADVAMYVAKQVRGTYAVYDPRTDTSSLSRVTVLNELRRALDEDELVLYYQPKAQLPDGHVRSVEALLRWEHPTRGLIGPCEFLAAAEQTGLITPLTEYVLTAALRQVRLWLDEGRDLSVSVNLSARNLADPHLPDRVDALLHEHGVAAHRLEVEVTETSAMTDPHRAVEVLARIAQLGVAVTVDDYGTGYSSLAYLRSLPIGTLKIDRSFVTEMLEDEGNAVIVRSTIELAHNLGLTVVAEGVEDAETYVALADLGCHVAQGFYLGTPAPASEMARDLDRRRAQAPEPA